MFVEKKIDYRAIVLDHGVKIVPADDIAVPRRLTDSDDCSAPILE